MRAGPDRSACVPANLVRDSRYCRMFVPRLLHAQVGRSAHIEERIGCPPGRFRPRPTSDLGRLSTTAGAVPGPAVRCGWRERMPGPVDGSAAVRAGAGRGQPLGLRGGLPASAARLGSSLLRPACLAGLAGRGRERGQWRHPVWVREHRASPPPDMCPGQARFGAYGGRRRAGVPRCTPVRPCPVPDGGAAPPVARAQAHCTSYHAHGNVGLMSDVPHANRPEDGDPVPSLWPHPVSAPHPSPGNQSAPVVPKAPRRFPAHPRGGGEPRLSAPSGSPGQGADPSPLPVRTARGAVPVRWLLSGRSACFSRSARVLAGTRVRKPPSSADS